MPAGHDPAGPVPWLADGSSRRPAPSKPLGPDRRSARKVGRRHATCSPHRSLTDVHRTRRGVTSDGVPPATPRRGTSPGPARRGVLFGLAPQERALCACDKIPATCSDLQGGYCFLDLRTAPLLGTGELPDLIIVPNDHGQHMAPRQDSLSKASRLA